MNIEEHRTKIFGQECTVELMHFDKKDGKKWKEIFNVWKELKLGMRDYKSREPNFPEGLSEVAFCLWSGSGRYIKLRGTKKGIAGSFDTFNLKKQRAEQIKACSVENDLTSFGPKSKWDDLYFLDFYNDGKLDGRFDIYFIPTKYISQHSVNKNETFLDHQEQKRRPRFCIKEAIIKRHKLKPIAKNVQVW